MRLNRRNFVASTGAAAGSFVLAGCIGDDEEEFPDDDILFIVSHGEGGGFDTYARAVTPMWEDELGDDANIIVENHPGGGGDVGMEMLYESDADGYTVGSLNIPGRVFAQLFDDAPGELRDMHHLGRMARATWVIISRPDDPPHEFEELPEMDDLTWSETGVGGGSWFAGVIMGDTFDIDINWVLGYDSLMDATRAVMTDETDISLVPLSLANEFIQEGELDPLLLYAEEQSDMIDEEVPLTVDYPEMDGWVDALNVNRVISAPGEIDDDVLDTLSDSLEDVLTSDEYAEWGEDTGNPTIGSGGMDVGETSVEEAFDVAEEFEDLLTAELEG